MGGDMQWGPSGDVFELVQGYGLEGEPQPLYATQPYTGEAMSLFQLGSSEFYFYHAIEGSLYRIVTPSNLEDIAAILDDESRGLPALEIEAL